VCVFVWLCLCVKNKYHDYGPPWNSETHKVCVYKIQRKMITKIQRTTGKKIYGPLVIFKCILYIGQRSETFMNYNINGQTGATGNEQYDKPTRSSTRIMSFC
jgi:hypothetical protein